MYSWRNTTFTGPTVSGQVEAGWTHTTNRSHSLRLATKLAAQQETRILFWKTWRETQAKEGSDTHTHKHAHTHTALPLHSTLCLITQRNKYSLFAFADKIQHILNANLKKKEMTHWCRCIHLHQVCIQIHSNSGSYRACSCSAGNTSSPTHRTHSHLELIWKFILAIDLSPCGKWCRGTQVMDTKWKT